MLTIVGVVDVGKWKLLEMILIVSNHHAVTDNTKAIWYTFRVASTTGSIQPDSCRLSMQYLTRRSLSSSILDITSKYMIHSSLQANHIQIPWYM